MLSQMDPHSQTSEIKLLYMGVPDGVLRAGCQNKGFISPGLYLGLMQGI
jgi:hypothetical protein